METAFVPSSRITLFSDKYIISINGDSRIVGKLETWESEIKAIGKDKYTPALKLIYLLRTLNDNLLLRTSQSAITTNHRNCAILKFTNAILSLVFMETRTKRSDTYPISTNSINKVRTTILEVRKVLELLSLEARDTQLHKILHNVFLHFSLNELHLFGEGLGVKLETIDTHSTLLDLQKEITTFFENTYYIVFKSTYRKRICSASDTSIGTQPKHQKNNNDCIEQEIDPPLPDATLDSSTISGNIDTSTFLYETTTIVDRSLAEMEIDHENSHIHGLQKDSLTSPTPSHTTEASLDHTPKAFEVEAHFELDSINDLTGPTSTPFSFSSVLIPPLTIRKNTNIKLENYSEFVEIESLTSIFDMLILANKLNSSNFDHGVKNVFLLIKETTVNTLQLLYNLELEKNQMFLKQSLSFLLVDICETKSFSLAKSETGEIVEFNSRSNEYVFVPTTMCYNHICKHLDRPTFTSDFYLSSGLSCTTFVKSDNLYGCLHFSKTTTIECLTPTSNNERCRFENVAETQTYDLADNFVFSCEKNISSCALYYKSSDKLLYLASSYINNTMFATNFLNAKDLVVSYLPEYLTLDLDSVTVLLYIIGSFTTLSYVWKLVKTLYKTIKSLYKKCLKNRKITRQEKLRNKRILKVNRVTNLDRKIDMELKQLNN